MSRRRAPVRALAAGAVLGIGSTATQFPLQPAAAQEDWLVLPSQGDIIPAGRAGQLGAPGEGSLLGLTVTSSGRGYWALSADGRVHGFGDAAPGLGDAPQGSTPVDLTGRPRSAGYWVAGSDGGVFTFGDAPFLGSLGGIALNSPVTAIASTPSGDGYWLVAADGGVFTFGDAPFLGSLGGIALNSPVTAIASTPSGDGYWLVAADGGVFTFGDATFLGSLGGVSLNAPVTGMAATSPRGYWLVAADGGVFTFGDAAQHGRFWADGLVTDLAPMPDGTGYWATVAEPPPPPPPPPVMVPLTGAMAGEPGDEMFDRLAQCESGGRWDINTGNGFYGGLQFMASTWRGLGGSGLPHEHSREEQIEVARRQWRRSGWSAWPHCGRRL